ncbi:prolyl oligopeptidase family serine peptidase [Porticoccus sp. W117]|uniref:prolyl oligopeptidase family serine peptidase n=1 Tax=Porticoccus sp. W117 TaxID=3054777 RepID=UPI00259A5BEA|nr:prolyl oligopeptidase family serine peptidase [Porticoccus sp. W117]MDM3871977.1 prolyl oligopeptidase family serine peptidase [Porticoccus sp. W117]
MSRKLLAPLVGLTVVATLTACSGGDQQAPAAKSAFTYPDSKRDETVVDDYHGTKVADPYRWLEDDVRDNPQVAQWVKEQNAVTNDYLQSMPERKQIEQRMTQLWDYAKVGMPTKKGDRYFLRMNSGLQNQSPVYQMTSLDDEPTLVMDPNTWSDDGTTALAEVNYSPSGKYIAYGIQEDGSDWRTGKILDVDSGKVLDDEILGTKYGFGVNWLEDESGFYYSRFPIPESGADFQSLNHFQKVYFHKLGTPQSEDVVIFENKDEPEWGFSPSLTDDNRYLLIYTRTGTDRRYRVQYIDRTKPDAAPVTLIDNFDYAWGLVHSAGSKLYFVTTHNAPLRRVVMIDLDNPTEENWVEVIPEQDLNLDGLSLVGGKFIAQYLKDALTEVRLFDMDGKPAGTVELPGIGSASGFGGKAEEPETFYSFSGYTRPGTIYRYNVETGESTLWKQPELAFNPDDYESKQVFYPSKDGTKIPMIISHKKGVELDGKNPTLIYGYGGFNISLKPRFSVANLAWMEMGGIYAVCNLRGGGEYGEKWHKAGTKLNKQNVFDDFHAGAEYLIKEGYTSPEHLASYGRSNGGLLIGATINQRPELYAAALPTVGVMDMLRFNQFTAGRYWVDDYGNSANPDEFAAQIKYSPYHNAADLDYPAVMVNTADTDDRVVPGHSFKYIAAMQHAYTGDKPMLIRIESNAGHGSGKPTHKTIEEYSDMWAFIAKHTGLELPEGYGK